MIGSVLSWARRAWVAVAMTFIGLVVPALALAQQDGPAESLAFEAGAQHENISGGSLLVSAYAVVLVLLVGYVVLLGRKHSKIVSEVNRLERSLAARASDD